MIGIVVAVAIVVGCGSFYGGTKYDQSAMAATRQARFGQFAVGAGGVGGRGGRGPGGMGGGFVSGDILSKDDKSLTIKLRSGGSQIVFLSDSTQVLKSTAGSMQDLIVGDQVTVTGGTNSDGSVTAQMIQIRPAFASSTSSTVK